MDEAQEILINSLENSGISLPTGVFTIKDLTQAALVSICAQSLHRIDNSLSFPASLPDSMAERFKICSEISSAVKSLGYRGDMSFHQFLYPSEEDSYKLVRFLVEKLSEESEGGKVADQEASLRAEEDQSKLTSRNRADKVDSPGVDPDTQTIRAGLKVLRLKEEVSEPLNTLGEEVFINGSVDGLPQNHEPAVADVFISGSPESNEEVGSTKNVKELTEDSLDSRNNASGNKESSAQNNDGHVTELQQKLASLRDQSSKLRIKIEDLRSQENILMKDLTEKSSESQHLEVEHELLKKAVEMALDDQHPVDFYIEDLNKQVEARRQNLVELEAQWDAVEKSLLEKKRILEESFYAQNPELLEKLQKMKEFELETEAIRSEIQKREEEHSRLSVELKNQPKVASRKSYIQRITEITRNSRKQDADIERILKETRELQMESNSIQDRLHRTYAVVDETVFRDAKKDPVRRQAYMLLTSIHESFDLVSQKILATDRARREATEQEAKLAKTASHSLNIDKLQADLEAIRKENEFLEQQQLRRQP
ncbi:Protein of unknown function DUF812 [Macleaya cordata]|uniref:Coiled-coil domain-containing protein 22 n=1 Tax=Macleaya cordata TaxID=56857 RepID=A0A200QCV1_MACCD|nr:Protein of unknown function DUF812 [Macleaya cordata]